MSVGSITTVSLKIVQFVYVGKGEWWLPHNLSGYNGVAMSQIQCLFS